MYRFLLFLALALNMLLGAFYPAFSESSLDFWAPVTLDVPLKGETSLRIEVQNRWDGGQRDYDLIQIRPSIATTLGSYTTLRGGYLWGRTSPSGDMEHRPWGEILIEKPLFKKSSVLFVYRQRNELRFFTGSGSPALRTRHLTGLYIPVTQKTGVNLNNETLIHLFGNGRVDGGFDQNRTHLGLEHQITPRLSGELAYRFIMGDQPQSSVSRLRHVIFFQLNYALPSAKTDHHL